MEKYEPKSRDSMSNIYENRWMADGRLSANSRHDNLTERNNIAEMCCTY